MKRRQTWRLCASALAWPALSAAVDPDSDLDGVPDSVDRCDFTPFERTSFPTACVHPNASIGAGVTIGPDAYVEDGAWVGAGAVLGTNSYVDYQATIGTKAWLGTSVQVGNGAAIGRGATIGQAAVIHHFAVVGAAADVAPFAILHPFTVVGGHAHVGADSILGGEGSISSAPTVVGRRAWVGEQSTVARGAILASDSHVGDGALVHGSVGYGAFVANDLILQRWASIGNLAVLGVAATLDEGASVGREATLGAAVHVGEGSRIGAGVAIASSVTLHAGVRIGAEATVGAAASLLDSVRVGRGATICPLATVSMGVSVGAEALVGYNLVVPELEKIKAGATWGPRDDCFESGADSDTDGTEDGDDTCPYVYNPDQADLDGDGVCDIGDPAPGTPTSGAAPDGFAITAMPSEPFTAASAAAGLNGLYVEFDVDDPPIVAPATVTLVRVAPTAPRALLQLSVYTSGVLGFGGDAVVTFRNVGHAIAGIDPDDLEIVALVDLGSGPVWYPIPNCSSGATTADGRCTSAWSEAGSPTFTEAGAIVIQPTTFALVGPLPDQDSDGVPDGDDTCAVIYNPDQVDLDGDGTCDLGDSAPGNPTPGAADDGQATTAFPSTGFSIIDSALGFELSVIENTIPDEATVTAIRVTPTAPGALRQWSVYTHGTLGIPGDAHVEFSNPGNAIPGINHSLLEVQTLEDVGGVPTWVPIPNCSTGQTTPDGRCTQAWANVGSPTFTRADAILVEPGTFALVLRPPPGQGQ